MATTGAMNGAFGKIEIRIPGGTGTWTDISGSAQSIDPGTMKRMYGKVYPLDSDSPKHTYGKQEGGLEVTINAIYTEVTTEAYQKALTAFETLGGDFLDVRFTPGGSVASSDTYTISLTKIVNIDYPKFDGSKADPIMASFTVAAETIAHAAS